MKASYKKYSELRDAKGYTDARVAKETGIGATSIYDWRNGRTTPKLDKLLLIAKLFGVKIEALLEDSHDD